MSLDSLPCTHGAVEFSLPLRIGDDGAPCGARATRRRRPAACSSSTAVRAALRDSALLAASRHIADDRQSHCRTLRPMECRVILPGTPQQHGIGARARAPFSWTSRSSSCSGRSGSMGAMTPGAFIAKWRASELKERSAAQEHFIDLCRLLGEPTPAEADPTGEHYCFERGARKDTGGDGWAGRVEAALLRLGIQGKARRSRCGVRASCGNTRLRWRTRRC